MKTVHKQFVQRPTVLALSLLAAFGSAYAEVEDLVRPDSSVSVGVISASGNQKDRAILGQYDGLRQDSAGVLLDLDINKRDDDTGTWTQVQGRNLGLDNRELKASYVQQGVWYVSGSYDAITHDDPRTLVSGTGAEQNLRTKREAFGLATGQWITPRVLFELDFKNEQKTGARLNGLGIACGVYSSEYNVCGLAAGTAAMLAGTTGGMLLVPEPIDATTNQIDARLSYSGEKLKLHGGYYGSFYSTNVGYFSSGVTGGLVNPDGTPNASANLLSQLNNQAHQFYVDGIYAFTPSTRANFKLAMGLWHEVGALGGYTRAQRQRCTDALAQVGLSLRPMPKLSLTANVRYEDKEDGTPQYVYSVVTNASGAGSYKNILHSSNKLGGKLEASYLFPHNYQGTLGVDYQEVHRDRPVSTALVDGLSGLREDTKETTYRAEVRRGMSETLNASVGYSHAKREGSSWLSLGAGFPAVADSVIYAANGAFPFTLQDRTRDKIRLAADWSPSESLSVQFNLENGKDSYRAPTLAGLKDSDVQSYGVDAAWKLSEKWKITGYWNQGKQTQNVSHAGYLAELNNTTNSLALGFVGTPAANYEVGANLSYLKDNMQYQQSLSSGLPLVGGALPDVNYRATGLNLFAKRTLEKNASVRVDLVHQRAELDDWAWGYNGVPFTYSDNASVTQQPRQSVTYLGVTYVYWMK